MDDDDNDVDDNLSSVNMAVSTVDRGILSPQVGICLKSLRMSNKQKFVPLSESVLHPILKHTLTLLNWLSSSFFIWSFFRQERDV